MYISIYLHIYTHSSCATRNFPLRVGECIHPTGTKPGQLVRPGVRQENRAGSGLCALCGKDPALSALKTIVIMIITNLHCTLLLKIIESRVNGKETIGVLFFFVLALDWVSHTTEFLERE